MKKLTLEFRIAEQDRNVINDILQRNNNVELYLKGKISSDCLSEATVQHFFGLTISQLKDFIHARKFNGRGFQESILVVSRKLCTVHRQRSLLNQTAVHLILALFGWPGVFD